MIAEPRHLGEVVTVPFTSVDHVVERPWEEVPMSTTVIRRADGPVHEIVTRADDARGAVVAVSFRHDGQTPA